MTKNPIESPQTVEKNANKNKEQVQNEAIAYNNQGNTKEKRTRSRS